MLAADPGVEQDEEKEDTDVEAEALPVELEVSEDTVEDVRAVVGAASEVV